MAMTVSPTMRSSTAAELQRGKRLARSRMRRTARSQRGLGDEHLGGQRRCRRAARTVGVLAGADDVAVGDDVAALVDDDAGADRSLPPLRRGHLDGDDAVLGLRDGFDDGIASGERGLFSVAAAGADAR